MQILSKQLRTDALKKGFKEVVSVKYFNFIDFKEERTKKFTTLVLSLVALSILGLFAINPTISTIIKLQKEIEDSKFVDQKLVDKINNLTKLQQEYELLKTDLPIIFSAVPQNPEIPLLVAQVQAIAVKEGVNLINIQSFQVELEKPQVIKKFSSYSFSLTAEGSYDNLLRFLSTITNMERVVAVDIVSITRKTGDSNLQLTFKGRAFFNK